MYRSDFSNMALPNAVIAAFSRDIQTGLLINLLWAGPDQVRALDMVFTLGC